MGSVASQEGMKTLVRCDVNQAGFTDSHASVKTSYLPVLMQSACNLIDLIVSSDQKALSEIVRSKRLHRERVRVESEAGMIVEPPFDFFIHTES